jgi:hypothetical protein
MGVRGLSAIYTAKEASLQEGKPDLDEGFRITIIPSPCGEEINKITAAYRARGAKGQHVVHLDSDETVGCLSYQLCDRDGDCSFYQRIKCLIEKMCPADVNAIMESSPFLPQNSIKPKPTDMFFIGLATYLGFLALLEVPEVWDSLPFQFNLPSSVMSGNALNRNMFRYLEIPLHAARRVAKHPSLFVIDIVLTFINGWGHFFDEGPCLDHQFERSILETIVSFSASLLEHAQEVTNGRKEIKQAVTTIEAEIEEAMSKLARKETDLSLNIERAFIRLEEKANLVYDRIDQMVQRKQDTAVATCHVSEDGMVKWE